MTPFTFEGVSPVEIITTRRAGFRRPGFSRGQGDNQSSTSHKRYEWSTSLCGRTVCGLRSLTSSIRTDRTQQQQSRFKSRRVFSDYAASWRQLGSELLAGLLTAQKFLQTPSTAAAMRQHKLATIHLEGFGRGNRSSFFPKYAPPREHCPYLVCAVCRTAWLL